MLSIKIYREIEFNKIGAVYFKLCGCDCLLIPDCDFLGNLGFILLCFSVQLFRKQPSNSLHVHSISNILFT